MKIKAVVFDWDGTLFNSMEYKRGNFVELFGNYSIPKDSLIEFHKTYSGIPRKDLFNKCLELFTKKTFSDSEYEIVSAKYTQMNLDSSIVVKPFDDVLSGLQSLKQKELKLFVSSSSAHDELTEVSQNSGLRNLFEEVLGSRPNLNKGPEHINYLCHKFSLNKNEILFVGDDKQDLVLGEKAGVKTIRIHREMIRENEINSISEVLQFLD